METISRKTLKDLWQESTGPCASLYLPTHRTGEAVKQGSIRLKNLLRAAEQKLLASGLRLPEAESFLKKPRDLLNDGIFWSHQEEGLALFVAPDLFFYYRAPLTFQEELRVGRRFYFKPLLPMLSGDGSFYLLALSQNQVRLFQGSRESIRELHPQELPASLSEALQYDSLEKSLQFHTGTAGGGGARPAIFHGQGAPDDTQKAHLLRYFQEIDRGMKALSPEIPLLLAGVERHFSLYREANTHALLLPSGLPGNPEGFDAKELHRQAWALLEPYFLKERAAAAERLLELSAKGRASLDVREVVSAAYAAKVETLFVSLHPPVWGRFDPKSGQAEVHPEALPGDEDLLELSACHALLNDGILYADAKDKLPGAADASAIFRF